ncbi:hypothetical protein N5K27_22475 [Pigmentiphaga sp. GD03639]|uniref:portal protein n=1 Tax=Pigmentiphaga sp. GD03639 TaxID=2975354 RepID=UPI00244C50D8|nr:hypothetical protein [Pigmentiphaga sp. GD03639]MDH2239078.1 hypothetical protein [Pigmentiphaga sp. GD03639]
MESQVIADNELSRLVGWFEDAEDATAAARRLSERDREYYDNQQWTRQELEALRKRGQPALTINYIQRKVDYLRGLERRMRSDPKAFPRTPREEQLAGAATDALRFIADQNDFDEVRSRVYENLLVEGYGGADVVAVERPDGQIDVAVEYVPWDRIVYDPHSREPDFSDARYVGIVVWMDRAEALLKWPGSEDIIEATFQAATVSDTYDDRPKLGIWTDNRRTRVRIVQMQYVGNDGTNMICTFTRGGVLEEPAPSPYIDEFGQPARSLILRGSYIDRENNRYGHVRSMISMQDEINKRRSKALHLLSVRQTYGNTRAITDKDAARRELAKPDGHLEINADGEFGKDFGILPTGDMAAGQMQLLAHVTGEMQAAGPNAAMAGKDPRQQSGRAIQAQQQGGSIEVEPSVDDLRQWSRQVFEAVWLRVRQFWTEERWIRVTDDERNLKWVGLNRRITLADQLQEMPPEQAQQAAMQMGLQPNDPRLQQVVDVENEISGLNADIVIEEGPDLATLQSEQFQMLVDLARAGMPIPPDVIIQASSLRNKDALLERMEKAQQQQAQAQEQAAQAAAEKAQADVRKTHADAAKSEAGAAKTVAETERTAVDTQLTVQQAMAPVAAYL